MRDTRGPRNLAFKHESFRRSTSQRNCLLTAPTAKCKLFSEEKGKGKTSSAVYFDSNRPYVCCRQSKTAVDTDNMETSQQEDVEEEDEPDEGEEDEEEEDELVEEDEEMGKEQIC